jgi:WD40 repeat protein
MQELVAALENQESRAAMVDRFCFDQAIAEYFSVAAAGTETHDQQPREVFRHPLKAQLARRRMYIGGALLAVAASLLVAVFGPGWWLNAHQAQPNIAAISPTLQPAMTEGPGLARIVEIGGQVEIADASAAPAAAVAGQMVRAGQSVRTPGDESFATIEYPDKTRLELSGDTTVQFPSESRDAGKQVIFAGGSLRADVSPQPKDQPMLLVGPQAQVRVQGTRFLMSSSGPDASRIDLESGKVELIRREKEQPIDLQAGCYAVFRADAEPQVGQLPASLSQPARKLGFSNAPIAMFTPAGDAVLAASPRLFSNWNTQTWEQRSTPVADKHESAGAGRAVMSCDGTTFAFSLADGTIRVWQVSPPHEIARLGGLPAGRSANVLTLSPDGSWLAAVDPEKPATIRRWITRTGEALPPFETDTRSVNCLAVSPDGRYFAAGTSAIKGRKMNAILRWQTDNWRELPALSGHLRAVQALTFWPEGNRLASAGGDGRITFWDMATGQENGSVEALEKQMASLAISPDGSLLAGGTTEGQAWIWDTTTGDARACLDAGRRWVWSISFSPDGQSLTTSAFYVPVMVWDISSIRTLSGSAARAF